MKTAPFSYFIVSEASRNESYADKLKVPRSLVLYDMKTTLLRRALGPPFLGFIELILDSFEEDFYLRIAISHLVENGIIRDYIVNGVKYKTLGSRPCRFEEVTLTVLLVSHFMSLIDYSYSYVYACAKFDLIYLSGCFTTSLRHFVLCCFPYICLLFFV
jgi:hypothetical protein